MQEQTPSWPFLFRVAAKTAVLFALFNLAFAAIFPLATLGRLSLYNTVAPGRPRLPYGENAAESYNLSLNNLPAMLHSHRVVQPKTAAEFRVLVLGDSGVWGWFLENEDTLTAHLNDLELATADGRSLTFYNLGYPVMSLTKDLLILDAALAYNPDLIIWPVTLASFPPDQQLIHPIVQHNPERIRPFITAYDLPLDPADPRFVTPDFWQRTIVGQRRPLANWLRLQLYAFAWAATGVDQAIPADVPRRQSDFEVDLSWEPYQQPTDLTAADLAFSVLTAGIDHAGDVPVLLVNEPIFISDGANSELRYNAWYPRWAYDQYRALLAETAAAHQWHYADLWNAIPPAEFSDSPVHLTPRGNELMAQELVGDLKLMIKD